MNSTLKTKKVKIIEGTKIYGESGCFDLVLKEGKINKIVKSNKNLLGKIKDVKITKGNQNTLFGEIVDVDNKKDFAA